MNDLECLATAIYFEAGGEGRKGEEAVAEVIINRVKSRKYPNSVCAVVNQKGQFVFKRGRKMSNKNMRERAYDIARKFLNGHLTNHTKGAIAFHNRTVRPRWRLTKTVSIGGHIFYR